MINNTIYTSNSMSSTIYSNGISGFNISDFVMSTLQNVQNRASRLNVNDNMSYAEMLKLMQQEISGSVDDNKVQDKPTADMALDEYKAYIAEKIKKLNFDSSRFADDEVIQISDAGWQKMKSDSDYEQWVLSKITTSRQSKNQLAAMGFGGSYYILSFGANKSDYNEQSWVKNFSKLNDFLDGIYNSSTLFGTNSKSRSKSSVWGSIFSMQAERFKIESQVNSNYAQLRQKIFSNLNSF
ncbi:MAG: hypothetical protein IJ563_02595 [Selenomonadaceae bacterium]|nr:hypothetical protein [Selenomonadaceae bacterium]MBR1858105.1 hypothetical protein [Selenomonadaceae bacterium]